MKILNFGSLNIDFVYRVPHIVRPGETISSIELTTGAGGKGANQSAAIAKAGTTVFHAGKIGQDGLWLKEKLEKLGVDTTHIILDDVMTGNALIQVADDGENSIVLYGGGNQLITKNEIQKILNFFQKGDILLLQNEINLIPHIIDLAHEKGMIIYFNPAPFHEGILDYPLEKIDVFIVNEIEGSALAEGSTDPEMIISSLTICYPEKEIILTLGEDGVVYGKGSERIKVDAVKVEAVDTTAAGDTFIGYYISAISRGTGTEQALRKACIASSVTVCSRGAIDSIPFAADLE